VVLQECGVPEGKKEDPIKNKKPPQALQDDFAK
jgi:hypothetical protein